MDKDSYIEAAQRFTDKLNVAAKLTSMRPLTRDHAPHTKSTYLAAVNHFRFTCGNQLPTDFQALADYLLESSSDYAPATLALRVSAISKWHQKQGFEDPTKDPRLVQLLNHIRSHSDHCPSRAIALRISDLILIDSHITRSIDAIGNEGTPGVRERLIRDRAMLLIGFWRGLALSKIGDINVSDILESSNGRLILNIRQAKGLNAAEQLPLRGSLCPTAALRAWLNVRNPNSDLLFHSITRWGEARVGGEAKSLNIISCLRTRVASAGLNIPFSSLSLKRGFEQWAKDSRWDIQSICDYLGLSGLHSNNLPLNNKMSAEQIHFTLDNY